LQQLTSLVWPTGPFSTLRAAYSSKPEVWVKMQTTLAYLAGGWYALGLADRGDPILKEVFRSLEQPDGKPSPQESTKLVRATILAISQRTTDDGIKLFNDLFLSIDSGKVVNSFSTAQFFSRLHLNVIEDVVLALVNDDFTLSSVGKRWIEEDEQLVRQRLHADMKQHLR
jgi:cellulose synthase operon protein C